MKKCVFIIVAIFIFASALFAQPRKLQDMIGRWEIGGEENASLEIIDSSHIFLTYMGETKRISNLKVDFTKNPCWFDFTTTDSASTIQVKSLMVIYGEGTLKWQLFIDEERSPYFTASKGEIFYLKKRAPAMTATASSN